MLTSLKHNIILKLDSIGFIASTLCAIHCMAMPFILVFLSFYGLEFFANPLVEIFFILSSVTIGVFTFRHGYFKHHKKLYPFLLFITGLSIIFFGHYFFHNHSEVGLHNDDLIFLMISPLGAFLIAFSHYLNRKLTLEIRNKKCAF